MTANRRSARSASAARKVERDQRQGSVAPSPRCYFYSLYHREAGTSKPILRNLDLGSTILSKGFLQDPSETLRIVSNSTWLIVGPAKSAGHLPKHGMSRGLPFRSHLSTAQQVFVLVCFLLRIACADWRHPVA